MPIHDWVRVPHGVFHHFHQAWTIEIANTLNAGNLPSGFFALAEQGVRGPIPDVVTLQRPGDVEEVAGDSGGLAVAEAPPRATVVTSVEADAYAAMANHLVIHHSLGKIVAVLEIVSPGNKSSQHALSAFVEKSEQWLREGIHLLIVDLFPPSPRDPQGIHKAIWDTIIDEPFELPLDKPLTVAAYEAGFVKTAYVEPVAVGDPLPDLPIFLEPGRYIPAPLESTYLATWEKCPQPMRELVEQGA